MEVVRYIRGEGEDRWSASTAPQNEVEYNNCTISVHYPTANSRDLVRYNKLTVTVRSPRTPLPTHIHTHKVLHTTTHIYIYIYIYIHSQESIAKL